MKITIAIGRIIMVATMFYYMDMPSAHAQTALLEDCGVASRQVSLAQWPRTDFGKCLVPLGEIKSGGPGKDGIPAIDAPRSIPVADAGSLGLDDMEPVISLIINGAARAWPLRYLIWHEIANDTLGGVPVAATYCPLCNAAIVFDRRLGDTVLDFGTTGNLRLSDLVMYDRSTESWWQQYTGEAIIGAMAGARLKPLPARLEAWREFARQNPAGTVMAEPQGVRRPYGSNPYRGYDTSAIPFLYDGDFPEGIAPLARVVVVEDNGTDSSAIALDLLRERGRITTPGGITLEWRAGQRSALDTAAIAEGRDVGSVRATRDGRDIVHKVTFAFVYHAFMPHGEIITR